MRLATCRNGDGGSGGSGDDNDSSRCLLTACKQESPAGEAAAKFDSEEARLAALACLLEVAGRPERARRLHAVQAGGDAAFPTVFAAAAALIAGTAASRPDTQQSIAQRSALPCPGSPACITQRMHT